MRPELSFESRRNQPATEVSDDARQISVNDSGTADLVLLTGLGSARNYSKTSPRSADAGTFSLTTGDEIGLDRISQRIYCSAVSAEDPLKHFKFRYRLDAPTDVGDM